MSYLRKLGFGPNGSEGVSDDFEGWLDAQLSLDKPDVGYSTVNVDSPITAWPDQYKVNLKDRVTRSLDYSNERRRIRKSNMSVKDKGNAQQEARERWDTRGPDRMRFVHNPVLADSHFKLRLMHFWLNHFTVGFATTASDYLIGDFVDGAIFDSLDGSFADMLYRVETHPAMLTYLDNIYNIGEKSQRNRSCRCGGLNDNLARESMELHTVSPSRGYTEDDIRNAAKIFAGWGAPFDEDMPEKVTDYHQTYLESQAEPGSKTVLGQSFAAGKQALRELMDLLANDPQTSRYLSKKLALHFIGESATKNEIQSIEDAWNRSGGNLPEIHRAVAKAAVTNDGKKFLWPLTWLFQLVRISDSRLFAGYDEIGQNYFKDATREAKHVMTELGMDFWSIRQPDGFSDHKIDWISSEHFERRVRFSEMLFSAGNPKRSVDDMIDIIRPGERTKSIIAQRSSEAERFVLLACSKEFFEV